MKNVFLDPDGTLGLNLGVLVIVEASTGIRYGTQCGGLATLERSVEGFLVPVAGPDVAKEIYDWFWEKFSGNCYLGIEQWTPTLVGELRSIVGKIPFWTETDIETHRTFLELDEERLEECVEAWIPVKAGDSRSVLTLANSD